MARFTFRPALLFALSLLGLGSCTQPQVIVPASLQGPRAMAIARGQVCMDAVEVAEGIFSPSLRACDTDERGSIGLVVNDTINRLAVVDMAQLEPRLIDLDLSVPGITHIPVGKWPIDVAVNASGTVAYTANQQSRSVSVVNLWKLLALPDELPMPGVPMSVASSASTSQLVVGLTEPSALWIQEGVACEQVSSTEDRRLQDPAQGCTLPTGEPTVLPLNVGTLSQVKLSPAGAHAYVLYADRPVLSIVALEAVDGERCLDSAQQAPCEVARIGLTFGCADGLDNDGDGLVDQADPQCYGPYHAESTDGLGRKPQDACADGLDNDNDGLIDRDDPECAFSSQTSEEIKDDAVTIPACGDGADNDGDGLFDYPFDVHCYGLKGRLEAEVTPRGFTAMGIDELGAFLYVADGPNQQVLVVDLTHRELIDAARFGDPVEPFASTLGVRIGRTPVPTAVLGRVSRALLASPEAEDAETRAVARYDYGAYVAADNGFVYYIDAVRAYCDVTEPDGLLSSADFYDDATKRAAYKEAACLKLPKLPLAAPAAKVESCELVFLCQSCLESNPNNVDACAICDVASLDPQPFEQQLSSCQLLDQRLIEQDGVKLIVNPRFTLRDRFGERGGIVGRATCTLSDEMIGVLEDYASANDIRGTLGCGSPLLPQPLASTVLTAGPDAPADYLTSPRLDFVEQRTLAFEPGASASQTEPIVEVARADERLLAEDINVTYEGVLPSTSRTDGLAGDADPSRFDVGSLDVCRAGIEVGDVLIIKTAPGTESGGVPDSCSGFEAPAERADFLSYRIIGVRDGELELEVIPDQADQPTYAQSLPSRSCFPRGLAYEVRVPGQWLVSGSTTGVVSGKERIGGVCVPTQSAASGRASARAMTGARYIGLYYSFYLYPGAVTPVRDLSFKMTLTRNFSASSIESGLTIQPDTPSPVQILFADRLPGGRFIFVVDSSDDVIYGRNLSRAEAFGIR